MKFDDSLQGRRAVAQKFPHAHIETPVDIGEGTQIWHFVHVMSGARIGSDCTIGQGVHVAPGVVIGDRCAIQNGAQLFTGVTLEDDVFVGPCAVFTNVLTPRAFVSRKNDFRPTHVEVGASIGANATIVCGVRIGAYAMVGAGAVVTKDVRPYTLAVGNPAKLRRTVCRCGTVIRRLTIGSGAPTVVQLPACEACGMLFEYDFRTDRARPVAA